MPPLGGGAAGGVTHAAGVIEDRVAMQDVDWAKAGIALIAMLATPHAAAVNDIERGVIHSSYDRSRLNQ